MVIRSEGSSLLQPPEPGRHPRVVEMIGKEEIAPRTERLQGIPEMFRIPLVIGIEEGDQLVRIRNGFDPGVSCRPGTAVRLTDYRKVLRIFSHQIGQFNIRWDRGRIVNNNDIWTRNTVLTER